MLLELPAVLACEVVGKWLGLKDVVRLDTAFCQVEKRNILHESIFQSPMCIIASPYFFADELDGLIFRWVLLRRLRLSTLRLSNQTDFTSYKEYLRNFGHLLLSVEYSSARGVAHEQPLSLIAQNCPNLRFAAWHCEVNDGVLDWLKSCVHLESVSIMWADSESNVPKTYQYLATHHLKLKSIDSYCNERHEKTLLGFCDPHSVQRLRLNNIQIPDWCLFVNLRSHMALEQVCTLCPWIINLDVSGGGLFTSDEIVPAIYALKQLCTFNFEHERLLNDDVWHALAEHHKHALEAVYMFDCDAMSAVGINTLLTECVHLRTMSFTAREGIDYSLMGNLTTIILRLSMEDEWTAVCQNCLSVQHLHLVLPWHKVPTVFTIFSACRLQTLPTVYVAGGANEDVHALHHALPSVRVVKEEFCEWYDLFELPV